MKECKLELISKESLTAAGNLWRLEFHAPYIKGEPGQFVNIKVEGSYLRRPISVSEYHDNILSLIISVVGQGTSRLVETRIGDKLDMLTGLGNEFDLRPEIKERDVLLIGGGVGIAPLIGLMKKMKKETDLKPHVFFGFNRGEDVPEAEINGLRDSGFSIYVSTMTGETGEKGNAVETARRKLDELDIRPSYFYTCGPLPMMNAVCESFDCEGELSMEARMGCGFGACMGCTIQTVEGPRRICKEGPVFKKSEVML